MCIRTRERKNQSPKQALFFPKILFSLRNKEERENFCSKKLFDFYSSVMSTGIISDSMVMNTGPDGPVSTISSGQAELDFAECDCCGLMEECTPSYIEKIRERYGGKWICGLCSEAVKDELLRCHKLISLDEAMARHFRFCNKFRASGPPQDPTPRLIRAMSQILRKSLDSPKSLRSVPRSPTRNMGELGGAVLTRSGSCQPSLTLVEASIYCGIEEGCE